MRPKGTLSWTSDSSASGRWAATCAPACATPATRSWATTATRTSATPRASADLVAQLPDDGPKVVWVMVPAGDPTKQTIEELGELLGEGDLVVDGGNSRWTDDQANADDLGEKGIGFVDCGVSGGVWGLENGYALMYGGSDEDVEKVLPAFEALKPEGEAGMVHAGETAGRRALRQDGSQRHRVRHDAGLRRGLGAPREGRPGRQRHRGLRLLARGHRDPVLAARPAGRRAQGRRAPRQDPRLRRGLRRGPVDGRGRHRQRRTRCTSSPPRCSPGSARARTTAPR